MNYEKLIIQMCVCVCACDVCVCHNWMFSISSVILFSVIVLFILHRQSVHLILCYVQLIDPKVRTGLM